MNLLPVVVLLLLASCSSKPPVSTPAAETSEIETTTTSSFDIKRRFENQIAEAILRNVRDALPNLEASKRVSFLREASRQFDRSVDSSLLASRLLLEKKILDYLVINEDILQQSDSYTSILMALSSLDWTPGVYEKKFTAELHRIDHEIAELASARDAESFDQTAYMSRVRKTAVYPEDTISGRQDYLDRLSQEMINAQADWFDTYAHYNPSELSILGEEGKTGSFRYSDEGLVINLDQVGDLPAFELKCLAVYYGFPGLQSFNPPPENSVRAFLNLPAYTSGWAGYILDEISIRDAANTLDYLYFARLQASLALADLRMHSNDLTVKKWTLDDAVAHISSHTPYSVHRIERSINQTWQKPGYYAAALAGKLKFSELKARCLEEVEECQVGFAQQVIDRGPMPFKELENLFFR